MQENNYKILLDKLNEFIRKYYVNQTIKGIILFLSIGLILFLCIVTLEYFGKFNSSIRTVLFYGFASILLGIFSFFIAIPLLKFLAIGSRISHEKASEIIGAHFKEVDDKLLNVLQLNNQNSSQQSDLVLASINQKIGELKPILFTLAINFNENKKYLKYLVAPVLIMVGLVAFQPKVITDSTSRIVDYNADFIPTAPYSIVIENKELSAFKNEDFRLKLRLDGEEIPNNLSIIYNKQRFLIKKNTKINFEYTFNNLQENIAFTLFDGEFESEVYEVKTMPKPSLVNFTTLFDFPAYLKKSDTETQNTGDIIVPEGTKIRWVFNTSNTEKLSFILQDSVIQLSQSGEEKFSYQLNARQSQGYGLSMSNAFISNADSVFYRLEVIPDIRPSISLDVKDDSLNSNLRYFKGFIKDDYGFSRLTFYSQFIGANDSIGKLNSENIPINANLTQTDYYHLLNIDRFNLKAGDKVEYFFEVWDNDGVNGSKSARTAKQTYNAPTKEELSKRNKESNEEVKQELKESIDLTLDIKKDIEKLKETLLNKKEIGFQEKQQLKSLLDKQKKVQQSLENIKQKNKQNNKLQEEFSPQDEALLEKQKQLEELFNKVMTEEMKEMMEKIEALMEKLKKEDLQKAVENIELNNDELEKELDRNLELFKQLELEKQLADAKEKLDELREEQRELKEESLDKKTKAEEQKEKQDNLNKEFDDLSKELDDIKKKNEELEEPNPFEDTKSLEDQIKKDMKESSDKLEEKNKKKASDSQENAEQKMDELSQKMDQMQQQMSSSSSAENLEDLRSLLENLIQLSFDQEKVMQDFKSINRNDPKYVSYSQTQRKLKDDSKVVEDSLFALSKRVPQLSSDINREMTAVNFNMEKAIHELGERKTPQANNRQQLAMTSLNNLALMLDNAVQNMQMQMQEQQGMGQCKKPGQGKPNSSSMKKLQQQLNQQMEALKKAMEQGKKPGEGQKGQKGKKPGKDMPGGGGQISKELAQMAAKQGAIREAVQRLQEQIDQEGKNGKGGAKSLKELQRLMEQTETDLVNKQITNETILRQNEILSRLLESEKAEREREKDEKREATEFTEELFRNPNQFFEYNKRKEQEIELLKTLPPTFNPYYKSKVSEYFNQIENDD